MTPRRKKRRSFRHVVNCELELRPLMNVFIVLIPMLLMSAVFMEIRVIEMALPDAAQAAETTDEPFDLAIRITREAYVLEGDGVVLAQIARETRTGPAPSDAAAAELGNALGQIAAAHAGAKEVRIVAPPAARYQELVAVMDLARAAGLPQAALEGAGNEGI